MIRGLALFLSVQLWHDPSGTDRWLAVDKAKHFIAAAFVQSASFSLFRAAGLHRGAALAGATVVSSAVSVGKELYDFRPGGDPSLRDLTWDAAGILAASVLLHQSER